MTTMGKYLWLLVSYPGNARFGTMIEFVDFACAPSSFDEVA
jgi:hypothetical protein